MYASHNLHYFDIAVSWVRGSTPLRYVNRKTQCREYDGLQGRDLDTTHKLQLLFYIGLYTRKLLQ